MTITYGEYKDFLRDLYHFISPQPKRNENEVEEIRNHLENNVTVEVPENLYEAVAEYKQVESKLQDVLADILNEQLRKRRKKAK